MIPKKDYSKQVKKRSENSPIFTDCIKAFLIGGLVCAIGQGLTNLYKSFNMSLENAKTLTSVTLVFIGILLTAIGIYDNIAKHAGAGTLVPITGFANSVASPSLEFKSEGYITGLGVKAFVIAGPVIVYGVSASVIYGIIYYIWTLVG